MNNKEKLIMSLEKFDLEDLSIGTILRFKDYYKERISVVLTKNSSDKFDLVLLSDWKNRGLQPYYVFGYNCIRQGTVIRLFSKEYRAVLTSVNKL